MHKNRLGTFLEKVILDQNFRKMLDFSERLGIFAEISLSKVRVFGNLLQTFENPFTFSKFIGKNILKREKMKIGRFREGQKKFI